MIVVEGGRRCWLFRNCYVDVEGCWLVVYYCCCRHLLHRCVQAVVDSGIKLADILAAGYKQCVQSIDTECLSAAVSDRLVSLGFSLGNHSHSQQLSVLFYCMWNVINWYTWLTRNTFCETWYLPHSRVHKSIAELCSNFGDSAITIRAKLHIFYCACTKRPYWAFCSIACEMWWTDTHD